MRSIFFTLVLVGSFFQAALCQNNAAFELARTKELLGVEVRQFPPPQGVSAFDELPGQAAVFRFRFEERQLTGPAPSPSYETRSIVDARAPDGTVYRAYSGRYDDDILVGAIGQSSSNQNPRQMYAPHHGYGFNPADVFIGRTVGSKIKTSLFFRDVGSHETAPHYITVDGRGNVHLIVSDVNISDDNELNVYSMIGNPVSGKWTDAVMLDRRGFTSWSHPWAGSWGDATHLLWDWCDKSFETDSSDMGLFYVAWGAAGYGRKVRVVSGPIDSYAAAVDPKSGRLVIAVVNRVGTYIGSRDASGVWTRPAQLGRESGRGFGKEVSISSMGGGAFVLRQSGEPAREWVVRPLP